MFQIGYANHSKGSVMQLARYHDTIVQIIGTLFNAVQDEDGSINSLKPFFTCCKKFVRSSVYTPH